MLYDHGGGPGDKKPFRGRWIYFQCLTPGKAGNDLAIGQVKEIMDTYDYFFKIENITRTVGGADEETAASYYEGLAVPWYVIGHVNLKRAFYGF